MSKNFNPGQLTEKYEKIIEAESGSLAKALMRHSNRDQAVLDWIQNFKNVLGTCEVISRKPGSAGKSEISGRARAVCRTTFEQLESRGYKMTDPAVAANESLSVKEQIGVLMYDLYDGILSEKYVKPQSTSCWPVIRP